jgi:hypothetical protein
MRRHHHFRVNSHSHLHHDYHKLCRFLQLATIQVLNPHTSFIHPLTSSPTFAKSMPPKGAKHFVATGTSARTTKHPTIAKARPSRPAATAAVREAAASAGPQRRIITIPLAPSSTPSRASSPASSQQSLSTFVGQIEAMQVAVMELKSMHEGTLNVLEEIKERLEAVETNPPIPVRRVKV